MGKRKAKGKPKCYPSKKAKKEKLWVQSHPETPKQERTSKHLAILITRSSLFDDYSPKSVNDVGDVDTKPSSVEPATEKSIIVSEWDSNARKEYEGNLLRVLAEEVQAQIDDSTEHPQICVQKSRDAKRPFPKNRNYRDNFVPLPNGDNGDGVVNPYPKDEVPHKYWSQRHRLFSKFDDGIQLDKESWYSITPEAIAVYTATKMVDDEEGVVVLDLFCGCGGNLIAFAQHSGVKLVVGVDIDKEKLRKAAVNLKVYGVDQNKVRLIHANACDVLGKYTDGVLSADKDSNTEEEPSNESIMGIEKLPTTIDRIFLSPPWGGTEYLKCGPKGYDLSAIQLSTGDVNADGHDLLKMARTAIGNKPMAYFLPKNLDGLAFGKSMWKNKIPGPLVMEQIVLNGKIKAVTCYLGLSIMNTKPSDASPQAEDEKLLTSAEDIKDSDGHGNATNE
eukprot:Nitzschia sp. Nitz4//scaffold57_size113557//8782//10189//NITZ4_003979-RA/size113557-augustus-gene-0.167-mRNA-1//1//CDS//3329554810//2039//frame0